MYSTFSHSPFAQQIDAIRGASPNNSAVSPSPIRRHIFSDFMKRLQMLAKLLFFGIAWLQNVISNYDSEHATALIISYYPGIDTYIQYLLEATVKYQELYTQNWWP